MSARNAMAAMLDELMGTKRNLDIGTDLTVTYDVSLIFPLFSNIQFPAQFLPIIFLSGPEYL